MRALALLAMVAALSPAAGHAAVDADDCRRHRDDFIASLEENRRTSIREIDRASRETDDVDQKQILAGERNEAFEYEERMRATGDQLFRDCMAHVRRLETGG